MRNKYRLKGRDACVDEELRQLGLIPLVDKHVRTVGGR